MPGIIGSIAYITGTDLLRRHGTLRFMPRGRHLKIPWCARTGMPQMRLACLDSVEIYATDLSVRRVKQIKSAFYSLPKVRSLFLTWFSSSVHPISREPSPQLLICGVFLLSLIFFSAFSRVLLSFDRFGCLGRTSNRQYLCSFDSFPELIFFTVAGIQWIKDRRIQHPRKCYRTWWWRGRDHFAPSHRPC